MHFVVTLVEKSYIHGAIALYNSLLHNGFPGCFIIGIRPEFRFPKILLNSLHKSHHCRIKFMEIHTDLHFTNYKPQFMKKVIAENPSLSKITYLDPDIILTSPFQWIEDWSCNGPLACSDVNYWFPSQHPLRHIWLELLQLKSRHSLDYYINGGFLCISRDYTDFLDLWQTIIESVGSNQVQSRLCARGEISNTRGQGRWDSFQALDQDSLNIAFMCTSSHISLLGPDVMSFTSLGFLPHAIGPFKPWERNYLLQAVAGCRPRTVDKAFWRYANHPIQNFTRLYFLFKRLELFVSIFLTRFYSKS